MISIELLVTWWALAQAAPAPGTEIWFATFAGYGITGILAALYILDLRKRDAANTATVTNILTNISPVLADLRDVMRATTAAHDASAAASKATSETLERFSQRIPSDQDLARITVALERLDRR